MIKRPLVAAAVGVFLILLCIPAEVWMKSSCLSEGGNSPDFLTGEICGIYPGGEAVCLKDTNASDTGIILVYFEAEITFSIGNTIIITDSFTLYEPKEPSNPGEFDSRLYYQTKNIVLICYADEAKLTGGTVKPLRQFFYQLREDLSQKCAELFEEPYAGVITAMLLADKSTLDDEVKELYQTSGMSHLLAVSGLHVSIFGMSLYRLLRRLGAPYTASGIPAVITVIAYGLLTGMSTSTLRAVIMCVTAIVADVAGRSYDTLSAIALAALILMLKQPLYVRSASFLLSFGAVSGIALVYPLLDELFKPKKGGAAMLFGLSVQLATLPLIELFYYRIPVYSVLLNLIVVPLMTLVMYLGTAAVAVGFVWTAAGRVLAAGCSVLLLFFEKAGTASLMLPGAVFICGEPASWQIAAYYACMAAFVIWRWKVGRDRRRRIFAAAAYGDDDIEEERAESFIGRKRAAAVSGFVLAVILLTVRFDRGFEFTMLDVGQGDGLFLRTGAGTTVLIDGGSSSESEIGTYTLIPFLRAKGVGTLDFIVVSHSDSDHISGIEEILEAAAMPGGMKVGALLIAPQALSDDAGEELAALARAAGTEVIEVGRGSVLSDKHVTLEWLYPVEGEEYEDQNACSCVIKLTYGEFTMLLTGDLEEEGEEELIDFGDELDCDVLKAGHHGSRTSSSEGFLEVVTPLATLISCGEDNSYGHPHDETLNRLEEVGSCVFITTDCGAITVRSDGRDFTICGYRE